MSNAPADRLPFDPTADPFGRRWICEPGKPLWTLERRRQLAAPGVEECAEWRSISVVIGRRVTAEQLIARRRIDGAWWGLCLLDVEWAENTWAQQLSWHLAAEITMTAARPG